MARDETKKINDKLLKADAAALEGLRGITDYDPKKAEFSLANVEAKDAARAASQKAMDAAESAWQKARDDLARKQWAFHNAIIGVRQQVVAQYGDDSDEAQAVGLKKKSERKPRTRKPKKPVPA